jgi:hypothetical protein
VGGLGGADGDDRGRGGRYPLVLAHGGHDYTPAIVEYVEKRRQNWGH